MKYSPKIQTYILLIFILSLLQLSCAKDSEFYSQITELDAIAKEIEKQAIIDATSENETIETDEDSPVSINFNNTGKSSIEILEISEPSNGKVENKNGAIIYYPNADFHGEDNFYIKIKTITQSNETKTSKINIKIVIKPIIDIINDEYEVLSGESLELSPLENDTFKDKEAVIISKVSSSSKGIININEDNTITYKSNANITGIDNLTYTTKTQNSNGNFVEEKGQIKITISNENPTTPTPPSYWQERFDSEWYGENRSEAFTLSRSKNLKQEYYYLALYIDGLTSIWQATGDSKYLDEALTLVQNTVNDATSMGNGYLGWPAADGNQYSLWDGFYWRSVATLIRIMHKSPILRSNGDYQTQFENLLAFSEKNIWDRYESDGLGNFYRSNTHMTSHWARIGMELYIITGKQKYKTVFENISFGVMVKNPSNLRGQLVKNPNTPSAYKWSSQWGNTNSRIQDVSHAGAIVSFIVRAFENQLYWNQEDIDALVSTLDNVIWKDSYGTKYMKNVDGSGGYEAAGRINEWLTLGRFSQKVQSKIKENYTGKNLSFFGTQSLGIIVLNEKILADKTPVYPEEN